MEFVKPPFIYCGMLIWVESVTTDRTATIIDCVCEIQTIRSEKRIVEVCDIISRSCFYISFDEVRVKMNGQPTIHQLDDSKFWNLIQHPNTKKEVL